MKPLNLLAALAVSLTGACDGLAPPTPAPGVEYHPELAGTVDHAMCLLGFTAVPIQRLVTGHQLVKGLLNDKPATFVLDTGANVSLVHTGFAEDFGLKPQRVPAAAIGLGGGQMASRASVATLQLGEVKARQTHVMLADLSSLETALGPLSRDRIDGIIGQDLMREHRAVIDVAKPMLYLQREDVAPSPVPAELCKAAAQPS